MGRERMKEKEEMRRDKMRAERRVGVFKNCVGSTEQLLQLASLNLIGRPFYIKKIVFSMRRFA